MSSEWDNTPWAGSSPVKGLPSLRKAAPPMIAYGTDAPQRSWRHGDANDRMATFLRAYKVGWFHKAGRKISESVATLDWSISDGDVESGDQESVIDRPDLDIPFDDLNPIEQLIRLLERPNPTTTGRGLFGKTQIRRDFAGTACWYLENGEGGSLPTAIYGISPARLWPSRGKDGTLIGWVLDKNRPSGGVPFSADEIVTFPMPSAEDDDEAGVGVVESVFSELGLSDLFARHTGDLLATGGRLAGMLSPKNRTLSVDEFEDAVRAWRSVASDPQAARRLLLFPEPMEYSAGASTPAEIGIPELSTLNRDNILTAFPIDPTMLGVQMPAGLNANGSTRRAIKTEYWQGTVGTRADALKEVIQTKLVSRYERVMGQTFDFDFDIPNLDDAPSIIEKTEALKGLVAVGFDPKEAIKAAGLAHVKWLGTPEPEPTPEPPETPEPERPNAPPVEAPAKAAKPRGETSILRFLEGQRDRITSRLRETLPKAKADRREFKAEDDWWDGEAEDRALRDTLRGLYVEVGREGLQSVADKLGRFVFSQAVNRITQDLVEYGGDRITNINERTRDAIKAELIEGTRRGYSIPQLLEGVEAEGFAGVQGALLDNGVAAWDPYRAEMIARTETALSFNRAAIRGYGEFGVREVQAIDGDEDAECAARNGAVFTVDEALAITDHPNGTLDWVPILDKAVDVDDRLFDLATKAIDALARDSQPELPVMSAIAKVVNDEQVKAQEDRDQLVAILEALTAQTPNITVNVPEQAAPVVNIAAPPPIVVPAPVVNVLPNQDLTVEMVPKDKRVIYDRNGRITRVEVIE